MNGTLWKHTSGKIYILKKKYITTQGNEYYVFIKSSGNHVTLRASFTEKVMTKIA